MKFLVLVFLLMALYGVMTNHLGGAILALGMAGLVHYARGHFARQDQKYFRDPRNAKCPRSTCDELVDHDCETS